MSNINRQIVGNQSYQKMLQQALQGELRIVNSSLPREQKPLAELLEMEYAYIICSDGSSHLFKRKELEYLSNLIEDEDQTVLLLPMLIEINSDRSETTIICRGEVEEKVIGKILDMPLTIRSKRIVIYKPQLAQIRKLLKTTTQYIFSNKVL